MERMMDRRRGEAEREEVEEGEEKVTPNIMHAEREALLAFLSSNYASSVEK